MIGVLDSGVGGLSIYRAIKEKLPETEVIYLADKKNFPYGEKCETELTRIVASAVSKLVDFGANIVVIACNSATVSTIDKIRALFDVPIIGIEPAVKQAAAATKTKRIGMMATKRTVNSHESDDLAAGCEIVRHHNGELVDAIEEDCESITDNELRDAIEPFVASGCDTVALGCTHYHFVKSRLERLFPEIQFFAPEEAIVSRLLSVISDKKIVLERGNDIFLVSADVPAFERSLKNLLEIEHADVREI